MQRLTIICACLVVLPLAMTYAWRGKYKNITLNRLLGMPLCISSTSSITEPLFPPPVPPPVCWCCCYVELRTGRCSRDALANIRTPRPGIPRDTANCCRTISYHCQLLQGPATSLGQAASCRRWYGLQEERRDGEWRRGRRRRKTVLRGKTLSPVYWCGLEGYPVQLSNLNTESPLYVY